MRALAGWPRRHLHSAFDPRDVTPAVHRCLARIATRARVLVALGAAVTVPFAGDVPRGQRLLLLALLVGVYLPYALVVDRFGRRSLLLPGRLTVLVVDLGLLVSFALVVPAARSLALFGYLILVVFHTFAGGWPAGLTVAGFALPLAWLAEVAGRGPRAHDAYTVAVLGVAMVAVALLVDAATRERRETARFLARLEQALAAVAPHPDLPGTLDSIAAAARRAAEARLTVVFLAENGRCTPAAFDGAARADLPERMERLSAAAGRPDHPDPCRAVLATGIPVVIADAASEERFRAWAAELVLQGCRSATCVPLRVGPEPVGALLAGFGETGPTPAHQVELLSIFGNHIATVILRARSYSQQQALAARLEAADRLKSQLIATISHDARNPLSAVRGYLGTALSHWARFEDAERLDLLKRALRNADALSHRIEQLLDYAALETGTVALESHPRDLAAVVARFLDRHRSLFQRHQLVTDYQPAVAAVDLDALDRILGNLVANAVKYSPAGTTVGVRTGTSGGEAFVSVIDEGPGLPRSQREQLFEPSPGVEAADRPGRSAGLGLAIVRRYVDLLGGRVEVDSEPGAGSTFTVILPLSRQAPVPLPGPDLIATADTGGGRPSLRPTPRNG